MATIQRQLALRGRWLMAGAQRLVLGLRALGGRIARAEPEPQTKRVR